MKENPPDSWNTMTAHDINLDEKENLKDICIKLENELHINISTQDVLKLIHHVLTHCGRLVKTNDYSSLERLKN